ncbi:hypothetical protein ACIPY3_00925 [Paenarthrobacter sp. NPDC089714]|uniref:hypothetical protein n=1 Tax=Paenarthrobacter sp. NPDC089714 TaxID=3364377 RepID=UPI0038290AA9
MRELLAEMGYEVQIHGPHAVDAQGRGYGFRNVAARCNAQDEVQWRNTIAEHLQRVLAGFETPDPFENLQPGNIAKQTFARLYGEKHLPKMERYPHREFAPGIVEVLALDLPDLVQMFDHDHARRFGGWEALRAQGIANLRELEVERLERFEAPGGGFFHGLMGNNVYTGSRALMLPGLSAEMTGKPGSTHLGWLMSVPNRHQLAWHHIEDGSVIHVLDAMARFTLSAYSEAPGPVSPHVYWWNGSGYDQLTNLADDGAFSVRVSPGFQSVLMEVLSRD